MDVTRGLRRTGWAYLVAVVDCHSREMTGLGATLRGWTNGDERVVKTASSIGWCARPIASPFEKRQLPDLQRHPFRKDVETIS